jgi:hypothetical protein
MHPDRRRAGRAIRKQRRLEQEQALDMLPAMAAFFAHLSELFGSAFEAMGRAFLEIGRSMQTPPERNRLALTPSPGALRLSEASTGRPTQTGGQALRSHSGVSASSGWIDEAVDFGGWEDR